MSIQLKLRLYGTRTRNQISLVTKYTVELRVSNYGTGNDVGNQTSYTFQNLDEGQMYYIAVTAYDTSDNESGYSAETVYTVPIPDLTAPSTPTSLQGTTISTSQINLSWNASTDNVGVTGYKIYRDGIQITTTANTTFQDAGLSPSTTYSYTVSAYDAAGNDSATIICIFCYHFIFAC